MRVAVVINKKAGRARHQLAAEILAMFTASGVTAGTFIATSKEILPWLAANQDSDVLVAAGGDGTINSVAAGCLTLKKPLGVLPLGTYNHFARDAGIPTDLSLAVQTIAAGCTRRVDVGDVNGEIFINNSSIGAYPRAVQERDELRARYSLRKHAAMVVATLRVFARSPLLPVRLQIDRQAVFERATPFVFVGNNEYQVNFFSVRLRSTLTSGKLCVYTARCTGLSGFLKLFWLGLWNRLEQARDFEMFSGSEVRIDLDRPTIRVARDGEVERMRSPLLYRIRPQALEVLVPA